MRTFSIALSLALSAGASNVGMVRAQEAIDPFSTQIMGDVPQSILIVNLDKLLRNSKMGQKLLENENVIREAHKTEGLELDAELEAEERELTKLRDELPAEEFEKLAIAFDTKVVGVRQTHQKKSEALVVNLEGLRQSFFNESVFPIIAQMMRERGASMVFEQRNVLFTGSDVDITADVIDRLDTGAGLQ